MIWLSFTSGALSLQQAALSFLMLFSVIGVCVCEFSPTQTFPGSKPSSAEEVRCGLILSVCILPPSTVSAGAHKCTNSICSQKRLLLFNGKRFVRNWLSVHNRKQCGPHYTGPEILISLRLLWNSSVSLISEGLTIPLRF